MVSSRGQGGDCEGKEEEGGLACSTNIKGKSAAKAELSGRGPHLTGAHMGPAAARWTLSNPLTETCGPRCPKNSRFMSERLSQDTHTRHRVRPEFWAPVPTAWPTA